MKKTVTIAICFSLVSCVGYYVSPVVYPPEFSQSHLKDLFKLSGQPTFFVMNSSPELNYRKDVKQRRVEQAFYGFYPVKTDIKIIKTDLMNSGFSCKEGTPIVCTVSAKRTFSQGELFVKKCLEQRHYEYKISLFGQQELTKVSIENIRLDNPHDNGCAN